MSAHAKIELTEHHNSFIDAQVRTGRFGSPGEVVGEALRLLEEREARTAELARMLQDGVDSGVVEDFDFETWLEERSETERRGEAA